MMEAVKQKIKEAQVMFRDRMIAMGDHGGLTKDKYVRFLSAQYHLTKGVQKHFYRIAANSSLAKRKDLRAWLVQFAKEEEFHFDIARKDLEQLNEKPLESVLDVQLWWLYFDSIIDERPFARLGGTCILENISNGSSEVIDRILSKSDYLTPNNTRFLTIHRHGPNLDHGNQVVDNLDAAQLNEQEMSDLLQGCEYAMTFYFRFMHWMFTGELLK